MNPSSGSGGPPHHELVFKIRLRAHAQMKESKDGESIDLALRPSFRAARREGMHVFAALQRSLERHGYELGEDSNLHHYMATLPEGMMTPLEETG